MNALRGPWGGYDLAAVSIPRRLTKRRHAGAHGWTDGPTCEDCA